MGHLMGCDGGQYREVKSTAAGSETTCWQGYIIGAVIGSDEIGQVIISRMLANLASIESASSLLDVSMRLEVVELSVRSINDDDDDGAAPPVLMLLSICRQSGSGTETKRVVVRYDIAFSIISYCCSLVPLPQSILLLQDSVASVSVQLDRIRSCVVQPAFVPGFSVLLVMRISQI